MGTDRKVIAFLKAFATAFIIFLVCGFAVALLKLNVSVFIGLLFGTIVGEFFDLYKKLER